MHSLSIFLQASLNREDIVWMLPGVRRVIKSFAGTLDSCQSPCQLVPLQVSVWQAGETKGEEAERSTRRTLLTEPSCSAEHPTKHRLSLIQIEAESLCFIHLANFIFIHIYLYVYKRSEQPITSILNESHPLQL